VRLANLLYSTTGGFFRCKRFNATGIAGGCLSLKSQLNARRGLIFLQAFFFIVTAYLAMLSNY
jgi:hypothetical protein